MPFVNTEHGYIFDAPVDKLINGMKYGQQLRMDLQRAADEHQAFITHEAMNNRNMRMQDLIDTANFAAAGRPVKDGMVEMQGQLLGMPISRAEVPAPEPNAPPSLQNLPETQTQVGGAALGGAPYPYLRPVDKSLLKSRQDLEGRKQQIEMYTPEEQLQRKIQMMGTENLMKALSDAQIREEMLKRTGFTPSPEMLAAKPGLPPRLTREEQIKEADEYAKAKALADKALILGKGAKAVTPAGKVIAENPEVPTPTGDFQKVFLPAYAENLHGPGTTVDKLSPKERMAAFSVYKQYDTNPEMLASIMQNRAMTQLFHQSTLNNQEFQRGQQSYQFHAGELDRLGKPIEEAVSRFSRLQDTISQNTPQADALVAPELMTVMAGGQGSGLRMNEAEISRVIGGRSKWEDLQAKINKWRLDPTKALSLTDEQRRQIRSLMDAVGTKLNAKQDMLAGARQSLSGTNDPMQHRQILSGLHGKLVGVDTRATGKVADETVIQQYLNKSGGDKVKARKALTEAGYTIPQ